MANRNRKGPQEQGPRTGRGMGNCGSATGNGTGAGLGLRKGTGLKQGGNRPTRGTKLNGKGPNEEGPKTGRGLGNCA